MSLFYIKCDCGEPISKIGTKNNVKGEKLKEKEYWTSISLFENKIPSKICPKCNKQYRTYAFINFLIEVYFVISCICFIAGVIASLEIFLNNEYSPTLLRYIFILSMFLVFAFYFIFKSFQPYKTIGE